MGDAEIPEYAVIHSIKSAKGPHNHMRLIFLRALVIANVCCAASTTLAQSLLENGDFENPTDPLKGWITDYAFTGNRHYVGNKQHISIVTDGARKNVVKFGSAGDAGVKMESVPFPFEPGFKYVCNLDIKGGYRLYFAGYQWAPGVKPHVNPELGELRMVYQSKATTGTSEVWKQEQLELPGVALSPQALAHLKKVRFLTVYIYMGTPGSVDNVTLTKVADPSMKF